MDSERLRKIEDIYHAALEVPSGQREGFFNERCGGDVDLLREVESLFAFENTSQTFIDASPGLVAAEMFSEQNSGAKLLDKEIGHYRIKSLLGVGGMGEVYLADDFLLNRKVALKVVPKYMIEEEDQLRRFRQEAQASSALNHPNILTIHAFGTESGSNYIVSEFVDGATLRERILSGMSVKDSLDIAAQIALALAAAHEAGIIHRDIKPDNIMIRRDGLVKVLDFGLAKLTEKNKEIHITDSESPTQAQIVTSPGFAMGTAYYMSPEQIRGRGIDARADIWSLGVVLYEMLTGQKPFVGESNIEVMSAILKEEPRDFAETETKAGHALQKIVRICLEKKPERRFHSAHDLGVALESLSTSTSANTRFDGLLDVSASGPQKALRPVSRERLAWILAGAFALLALASGSYAWRLYSSQGKQLVFRQLNFRREAVFQAVFAPDGKTVVYSAATEGNTPEIFTLHPDFPAPQPLGVRGMHLLDISKSGELAILMDAKYVWHRTFTGTLARMPLVGGAPRQVMEGVRHAAFSPDGSQLAIIREFEGKDRLEFPIGKVLVEVSGYMSDLRISPDGKHIAFFEHPRKWDDRGSINLVDLDGNKRMLSDGYWSERGIAWAPDGSEVLFSASISGGAFTIFAASIDGSIRVANQSPGGLILQDIARDGRWLTNRIDYRYQAFAHTPGMQEDRELSWLRTSHSKVLSQDGQTLLFMETSIGSNYAVCIRKTDGSPLVRLGEGTPTDLSPDNKSVLAFISSKPPRLVVYPTGAGETRELDPGNLADYSTAQWFRDGTRILIGGNEAGQGRRFFVQDASGGAPRAVTPEGTRDGRLSPDGKLLLARGAGDKYYLYSLDGGDPRAVPWLTGADVVIQWSADGRSWFVYTGSAIPCRVEIVNVETGRRELHKEIAPELRTGLLAVRPTFITDDLQSYAYTTYQQVSTLFVTDGYK